MIKKCIVCGKEFECYDKKHNSGSRTKHYKRAYNWKTCSHKCSMINSAKRDKRCEFEGCKERGVGFIKSRFLCSKHINIEKNGEPKGLKFLNEKNRKQVFMDNKK